MNPAASARKAKEAQPERYCADRKCLWNIARSGPCPKHARIQAMIDALPDIEPPAESFVSIHSHKE